MLATSIVVLLIPLWILLGLLFLMVGLGLLGRVQNGRYLRPIVTALMKVPLLKRLLTKAHRASLERANPELASALRKVEPHAKQLANPQQAQKVMSRLTREERAALLEMQEQQGAPELEATNRQMRRRLEKQRKRR
ncbi:MAG TPA: hypothetical protein VFL58_08080 [Gaiellaceae bacterium]|jgi:hypothetical protein|nr:hypothetical protein [Gaiellaceae bacterium]